MKQISKIKLVLSIFLLFVWAMSYSQTTILFQDENEPTPPPYNESPINKGHRMPYSGLIGFIDWVTEDLYIPLAEEIYLYELWLENACIVSTANPHILVNHLSQMRDSSVSVILYTESHIYIGTYNPINQ